ncbi:MAG: choice-of-anchor tandem repeat GloVer-containing protein [Bacteroidota bacterium]
MLSSFDPISKSVTKVADFGSGTSEGLSSCGRLTAATDGMIYGVTYDGGDNNDGTIFKFNPTTDEVTTVWSFSSLTTGSHPQSENFVRGH